ncbi:MAG: hypothetical protein ACLSS7_09955 [Eubacterium ventriosum]
MAKKLTQLQLDYKKQVKRLKQAVRRAEKRGYIVPENVIPKRPKKITQKSVERLKKITTKEIYSKSEKLDFETGELVPGEVARKQERSEAAKKAAKTRKEKRYNAEKGESEYYEPQYDTFPSGADIIIGNFKAEMSRFPEVAQPIANQWLDRLLIDYSKEDVAEMLENAAAQGLGVDYSIAYREDLLLDRLSEMLDLLPGASTGNKIDIMEAMEYEEDWEIPD